MGLLIRFLIAILAISGAVMFATADFGVKFGHSNFWDHHGLIFLVFVAFFPRLTLLFSNVATGGLLWWLSWLFAPRLLVAVLATLAYWFENPVLVAAAWVVAFGGESSEKYAIIRRSRGVVSPQGGPQPSGGKGYDSAKWVDIESKG